MADTQSQFSDVPVARLQTRIKQHKEARKDYEKNWDKAKQMYEGDQWSGISKMAWFQSEPIYNKVAEYVEIMRGLCSDNKWGVDAMPATAPTEDMTILLGMVDKVNKLLDFLWMDNRMQSKLAEVLQFVFLYGTGFLKVSFDPLNVNDSGIGQIETKVLSPRYIFPDPDATSVHDANSIFEHHPVSYSWVLDNYPDLAEAFMMHAEVSKTDYAEGRAGGSAGPRQQSQGKEVDIWECWYKDSTLRQDDGEEMTPAYPNGRKTLMTEDGFVLEDDECQYGHWPYIRFIDIPRPGEFFGDCTLHKALGIQENINQILRSIIDNGLWLVHGIWVADTTSGVTPKTLAGYGPRDVIMKHPGSDVHRDSGTPLPPHLFELLNQQVEAFDRVVGLPDPMRGIVPSRQPVQTTMMQMESAEVRTRERQRRVEEALEDLGRMWIDIVSNHWTDKRVVRSKNVLGGFDMFQLSKKDFNDWRWDVFVVPGSTGPLDKISTMQMLKEMRVEVGIPVPDSVFVRTAGIPSLEQSMFEEQRVKEDELGMELPEESTEGEAQPLAEEPVPQGGASGAVPDFTAGGQISPEELFGLPPGSLPPDVTNADGMPPMPFPSELAGGGGMMPPM